MIHATAAHTTATVIRKFREAINILAQGQDDVSVAVMEAAASGRGFIAVTSDPGPELTAALEADGYEVKEVYDEICGTEYLISWENAFTN